jgi:DNA-binding NarL/FixJ family response regulator
MTIRVLLVEDNPNLRKRIAGLIGVCPEIELIAEVGDGQEALRLACELFPDVLVSDLELPGLCGDEIAERLTARGSPVRTLLMSAHTDRFYIQGLLACTTASYLVKDDAHLFLVETIRRVARGEVGWFGEERGKGGASAQS